MALDKLGLIDADVHVPPPSIEELTPFMSDHWKEWTKNSGFKGPADMAYPPSAPISRHPDIGADSATTVESLAEAVLSTENADGAVLNCAYALDGIRHPYLAAELADSLNSWQKEKWLAAERRFFGSIVVPSQAPDLAVEAIERWGNDDRFVQVALPVRAEAPYGNRRYHPIFKTAQKHGLAVSIQYGGFPGTPNMSGGWASHLFEEHAGMAFAFQTHLASLVYEGVFDLFPDLWIVFVESGFTWLPSFLWRIDKGWKGLRRETPWVKKAPSEYILDRVRFTAQPIDSFPESGLLEMVIEQLEGRPVLMYSSDYPHWHSLNAMAAVGSILSGEELNAFTFRTASATYGLDQIEGRRTMS